VLVAWGEADQVVSPDYGRAYAAAFGNGRFQPIAAAGHLPQLEQPAAVLAAIADFAREVASPGGA
jgi:pimeloyl-ACP methyl ester carboxylesterase